MPKLKLTLAYEGTRYSGWQVQACTKQERPRTVQGELERCVRNIAGVRLPVYGAGRTDAGVHAEAQVCHLNVPQQKVHVNWLQALNVQLPVDVRVTSAEWVGEDFHARKSAKAKRYAYALWMHRQRALPRVRSFVWSTPFLDMENMAAAIPLLTGRYDFASFQNSGSRCDDTVRTLYSVHWRQRLVANLACPPNWPVLTLFFEGNGFLKQMVRNLVGLLVWAGLGKIDAGIIPAVLAARDRRALPSPSAPASGLTLMEVLY